MSRPHLPCHERCCLSCTSRFAAAVQILEAEDVIRRTEALVKDFAMRVRPRDGRAGQPHMRMCRPAHARAAPQLPPLA